MITSPRFNKTLNILNWVGAVTIMLALVVIFFYAPTERTMGNVQRIFYFHVGAAWVGAIAFFVAMFGGIMYLWKSERQWDTLALSSVEIGIVFLTMATVAGSVWGKPAWNTWWLWSPRLTLITIALLTYAAYFMLRGAIEDDDRRARFAAVYVIVAFVTIIMAYISVRILRDIHPVIVGGTAESAQGAAEGLQEFGGLDSARMGITLTVSAITYSIFYAALLMNRIRLQRLSDAVDGLKMQVMAHLQGENE
jgi:heme exporter protein C